MGQMKHMLHEIIASNMPEDPNMKKMMEEYLLYQSENCPQDDPSDPDNAILKA
ncbi:hypothetical protein CYXG_00030 [Synechococcus phage S-SSM4]|uniref:Uncharacterized protein n=1 Tax=Synechococcus phage S-SSM4 TaxID=536466 RepID=M1TUJ6_9CAUD|nr:hypothetical protein CYXG_00030 [Synechococcus phage S-SSM4]AGG54094.1 hypothetical protein CYXG_00030 [Synechococcus phage S-SSM4]AGG54329.1 hypothetical protein CYWG_00045 [Cyanophage S-SSM6b]